MAVQETSRKGVLFDAAINFRMALDASGVHEALFPHLFACLIVLRWIDLRDAEQEAMAIFENRHYEPILPAHLQWRQWSRTEDSVEMADLILEIAVFAGDEAVLEKHWETLSHPILRWLDSFLEPLIAARDLASGTLQKFVQWVGELPFETQPERREVLDLFDLVIAFDGRSDENQFSTPSSIAGLMVALGNPKPGERIYDPSFGLGDLLNSAWLWAERNPNAARRPGSFLSLLDVNGIEQNKKVFLLGLTRMLLNGVEFPHVEMGNSLEREAPSSPSQQGFDLILANPPMGAPARKELFSKHYPIATRDMAGIFIQHMIQQLKPGGRAVLLVPDGVLFRGGRERDLRQYLIEQGKIDAVVSLPDRALQARSGIKCSLLLLNGRGGNTRVRMVDASSQFEEVSGRRTRAVFIPSALREQLALEIQRPELRSPVELPPGVPDGVPGTGKLARSIWDVTAEELAHVDWDLTPRRREKGGLDELLAGLRETCGESIKIVALPDVAQITSGRAIKSSDLQEDGPKSGAIPYVRINDLDRQRVTGFSRWLTSASEDAERRWALLPGDVLLSKSGTIAKTALVRNGAVGAIASGAFYVLRVDKDSLDPGYLLAYLNSPACQSWLNAQARGATIQHLNLPVLRRLAIPLPPLEIQAKAAAAFRDSGIDAIRFIGQYAGSTESDRITTWLAELSSKMPVGSISLGNADLLAQLAALAPLAFTPHIWIAEEQISAHTARWLTPLVKTLMSLVDVSQIPSGPGLVIVLQEVERGFQSVYESATARSSIESQARSTAERLNQLIRAVIDDLAGSTSLRIHSSPEFLTTGTVAEFVVELENDSILPLRDLQVETAPNWGTGRAKYLAEHKLLPLHLKCDVPKTGDQVSLRLIWSAAKMNGQKVLGEIELPFRLREEEQVGALSLRDLGTSPYVTGSPLQPGHGDSVFFGRGALLERIKSQVSSHGNVVLLEGNRRVGKTSILKHLEGASIPGWFAVYANLQGAIGADDKVGVPTAEVFRTMASEAAKALIGYGIDTPLPTGRIMQGGAPAFGIHQASREGISVDHAFNDFREYLEQLLSLLAQRNLGLLIMLDEFDKLQEGIDSGVTSPQVPENIRFLIQTYPRFSAILTGSRRLKRLREEYWSVLYGIGTSVPVMALDPESARNVVTEPVRGRLVYSKDAVDGIVELTARHPYLLQCFCNQIFVTAAQTRIRSITLDLVLDAAITFARDNEHFASLWDYAAMGPKTGRKRRQLILLLCAQNVSRSRQVDFSGLREQLSQTGVEVDDEALASDLDYLRELDLIDLVGELTGVGQYSLTIPLMAEWIEQHQDSAVVASHARTEMEDESAE